MGTSRNHFAQQIETWRDDDNLIALDLPGHGCNPDTADKSFFRQALTWAYEQILRQGKGHIIGLSLGATVAIHLALEHPAACESIVLTGYVPAIPSHMTGLMEQQREMFLHVEEHNPEIAQEFKDLHGERWRQTLRAVLDDMTYNFPTVTPEQIRGLNLPTLVLNGANEQYERDAACEMANLNDRVQVGLIPGAGHTANMERPDIYNLMVTSFFRSQRVAS